MRLNRFATGILLLGLALLMFSCSEKKHHKKSRVHVFKQWPTGKVYKKVKVQSDTSLSYAVYLPKSYNPETTKPVMFLFDAHAGGLLPVKKYQSIAEKFQIILVASNNSKNGQSPSERNRVISGFMGDVEKQFNVDMKRIYTAGFSGGARVATLVALYNGNVAGVIGCAAGFPQVQNPVNTAFEWIGVVGNKDFNYLELKNLNRQLRANHFKSRLLVFDGKHEWPPAEVMKDAFTMVLKKNSGKSRFEIKDNAKDRELEKKEVQQQQMLARAMEEKSWKWWQQKILALQSNSNKAVLPEEKLVNERLVNYLSMISYIYTERALKSNQTNTAEKYLKIYEMADPDNPDVFFFKAVRFAMLKQDKQALVSLQKALDKGFEELSRINDYRVFDHLRNNPDFKKVLP